MGQMIATSTGSGAEGRGGDTAILDDPMSSEQALSDNERLTANRWVQTTLKQRLNDPSSAAIIVIMQRLHELDTTGFLKQEDPGAWTEIVIPLEAKKDERWEFPISGRVLERKKNEVLQPQRFPPAIVEEKRKNRLPWASQYQMRPAPLEGNLIKRAEIRYYGGKDSLTGMADESLPEDFDMIVISADLAFKDLATSDYAAVVVVGVKLRKRFVLNVVNAHLDVDGCERVIREEREKQQRCNPPRYVSAVLVEDKANGPAVITRLQKNFTGVEVNPFIIVGPDFRSMTIRRQNEAPPEIIFAAFRLELQDVSLAML
jgi:phage terminase large subunit-like protein